MNIALVTGGTGGHIYPALALAKAILDRDPSHQVFFIGNSDRMEATEIPSAGYRFFGLPAKGFSGSPIAILKAIVALQKSRKMALELLKREKPDLVIGFGGYVCVPVLQAAHKLHITTMLHEQNSVVGRANKVLIPLVDAIVCDYESNLNVFPAAKTRRLGNPRTYMITQSSDQQPLVERYDLDPSKPVVLFVMGSLGSASVNALMPGVLKALDEARIQAVYVTGKRHYETFKSSVPDLKHIRIVDYIDQLWAMPQVDLMVCRGGATTAAELTVLGVPSIIIPSPYVPNNHQYYNAKALFEAQASVLIEEKTATGEHFVTTIKTLLNDPKRLQSMREAAKTLGKPLAAQDMVDWIETLVKP
jgi:UDP-N-acetylglucosamine--N-acetylmuramyl-(pentapeptide) pyrophosphoryl-undecaprenol N-acetylglucosamine transferase